MHDEVAARARAARTVLLETIYEILIADNRAIGMVTGSHFSHIQHSLSDQCRLGRK